MISANLSIDGKMESYAKIDCDLEIVLELQNEWYSVVSSECWLTMSAAPVFESNRRSAQIEITKAINRMDSSFTEGKSLN